jgi:hypothetical protein
MREATIMNAEEAGATIEMDAGSGDLSINNDRGGVDVVVVGNGKFTVRSCASRSPRAFAFAANAGTGVATAGMAYAIHGCDTRIEFNPNGHGLLIATPSNKRGDAVVTVDGTIDAQVLCERGVPIVDTIVETRNDGAHRLDVLETAVDALELDAVDHIAKIDAFSMEVSDSVRSLHDRIDGMYAMFAAVVSPPQLPIEAKAVDPTEFNIREFVDAYVGRATSDLQSALECLVDDMLVRERDMLLRDVDARVEKAVAETMKSWDGANLASCQAAAKSCKDAAAVASVARARVDAAGTLTSNTAMSEVQMRRLVDLEMRRHAFERRRVPQQHPSSIIDTLEARHFLAEGPSDRSNVFYRCVDVDSNDTRLELVDQLYYPPYAINPPMLQSPIASGLGICSSHAKGQVVVYVGQQAGMPIERMRVTSAGLIGVGTQTPSCELDVKGRINALEICEAEKPIAKVYMKRDELSMYVQRKELMAVEARLQACIGAVAHALRPKPGR